MYSDPTICQRQCNCPKDLATWKYYGPYYSCSNHVFHPKVLIQNLGQDTIYHFEVIIDFYGPSYAPNIPVYRMADTTFDMAFAPMDTMLVEFETFYLYAYDAGYMKAYTLLTPGNADQRPQNSTCYYRMAFPPIIANVDTFLTLKLNTDQYGEEIKWNFQKSGWHH